MASTVLDLVKRSLRLIGAIAPGENPTTAEGTDALEALNNMLGSWSIEGLAILKVTRETFDLVAGTASYTMGPSQDFDTTRPVHIVAAGVIENPAASTTVEYPVEVIRDPNEWARIRTKETQSTFPSHLYYEVDPTIVTIYLWYVPVSATPDLVIYSEKSLAAYTATSDAVSLAPGYARAIAYNLAIDLAPEYGKEVPAAVIARAIEAKATLETHNLKIPTLITDSALLRQGPYTILSDRNY